MAMREPTIEDLERALREMAGPPPRQLFRARRNSGLLLLAIGLAMLLCAVCTRWNVALRVVLALAALPLTALAAIHLLMARELWEKYVRPDR